MVATTSSRSAWRGLEAIVDVEVERAKKQQKTKNNNNNKTNASR
jgi:hypothetical protein